MKGHEMRRTTVFAFLTSIIALLAGSIGMASPGSASVPGLVHPAIAPQSPCSIAPNDYWMVSSKGERYFFSAQGLSTNSGCGGSSYSDGPASPIVGITSAWQTPVSSPSKGAVLYIPTAAGRTFLFPSDGGSINDIAPLSKPIVGAAVAPTKPLSANEEGWRVASDGGVFTFNGAEFYGSAGNIVLNKPIVGIAASPTGKGYWIVGSDGGIFSFGDAKFYGSTGAIKLTKPVVGMAATPTGKGYWLGASDGGIFSFGDAKFYGSTGAIIINKPITGMTSSPSGSGYLMVASDGGVFSYGDAPFYGSAVGRTTSSASIVGITSAVIGTTSAVNK